MSKIAVWIPRTLHALLKRHAKKRGAGVAEEAEALISTGLKRLEALDRDRQKRKKVPKSVMAAAQEAAGVTGEGDGGS